MVSNRTFIAGNWSIQRADHGEQVDWSIITLGLLSDRSNWIARWWFWISECTMKVEEMQILKKLLLEV